ncbi:MAG: hypothetical protein R3A44_14195 [Caldilineaceae bacterium]
MEYENSPEIIGQTFDFLNDAFVRQHFADLNSALLNGRHIQPRDETLFQLLDNYSEHFHYYYESLYGLNLDKDTRDNTIYYYLDFLEDAQAKMFSQEHSRQLTQRETIIGVMLLNMYYDRYFDNVKEIYWSNIESEILEGKNSDLYKKLFFGDVRNFYTPQEWGLRKKNFKDTIRTFEKLGWVEQFPSAVDDTDDIHLVLQPSIHRLATLYRQELEHFGAFVEDYYQSKKA